MDLDGKKLATSNLSRNSEEPKLKTIFKVLYMCFERFLLAFESRDLSQADISITRMYSFPKWVMSSGTSFSVTQAWGLNFLQNEFCQSPQIYLSPEKTEKTVYFLSLETFEW